MPNCRKDGWGGRCPTCDGESCKPKEKDMLLRNTLTEERPDTPVMIDHPLKAQVGGDHYKKLAIQPVEYIHANGIGFFEGSVIKYVTRWRDKGGLKDLEKAKHFLELLIDLESKRAP